MATTHAAHPRRILVLFAHPAIRRSEVNGPMFRAAAAVPGVTAVDLYAEYPAFDIDVDKEQQRLLEHDVIVFLHPMYWYSTPALLKEWQDLVLEYGFAYGKDGDRLAGKIFFNALTTGGDQHAYRHEGRNHFTVRELLQPFEQTADLCQMIYLPPFVLFDARHAQHDGRIARHVAAWVRLLESLRDHRLDVATLRNAALLEVA